MCRVLPLLHPPICQITHSNRAPLRRRTVDDDPEPTLVAYVSEAYSSQEKDATKFDVCYNVKVLPHTSAMSAGRVTCGQRRSPVYELRSFVLLLGVAELFCVNPDDSVDDMHLSHALDPLLQASRWNHHGPTSPPFFQNSLFPCRWLPCRACVDRIAT